MGVEGGEQLVGGIHLGGGERIEQGRFAGVGIADQGDRRDIRALAPASSLLALAADLLQALLDLADAHAQQASVGFQLGLTRTAQADTAFLPFEVGPAAYQPRAHVLQLRQFHLQLAFVGTCALGEDVEDQPGPVEYAALERSLEVALLAGRQGVVENHQLDVFGLDQVVQLLDLATADKIFGARLVAGDADECHRFRAGRTHQLLELLRVFTRLGVLPFQMHQNSLFPTTWALKEQSGLPSSVARLGRLVTARQTHRTARYHGGDRVLVNHLADGVLQQDDKLVEGLDLALQLDAVDQIDGNRDAFFPQGIEVRVL